ncbi:hypothetical protein AVEN_168434-1 [Araneus ventricosus]|uniref:Uncharacterized protein n=1 Tax=Araneus ventricosus TaxID=182803 RepID=A0A4Y2U232_ARAVE|nr:hypothetical protein AVEN_274586-1 [Araneus ventricosus]GBO07071.1 hypothetical protein AVEN_168434-1 [Araneus ventricosus]
MPQHAIKGDPLGSHNEYVGEKPQDKLAVPRYPGGYNNGLGLPSAGDSACLLREGSGRAVDGYYDSCLGTRAIAATSAQASRQAGVILIYHQKYV